MTADSNGKPRMMQGLETGYFQKFWLGGSQALCGDNSHAACLKVSPVLLFSTHSPHPHPSLQSILGTPYFSYTLWPFTQHKFFLGGLLTIHIFLLPWMPSLFLFFSFFCLFRTAPITNVAYGSFQARALIWDVASSLHHSHSNAIKDKDWIWILVDTRRVSNLMSHSGNSNVVFIPTVHQNDSVMHI